MDVSGMWFPYEHHSLIGLDTYHQSHNIFFMYNIQKSRKNDQKMELSFPTWNDNFQQNILLHSSSSVATQKIKISAARHYLGLSKHNSLQIGNLY